MSTMIDSLPTITREVHEVHAEREVHWEGIVGDASKYRSGEITYTARTTAGDYIEIDRAEFLKLAAALTGESA